MMQLDLFGTVEKRESHHTAWLARVHTADGWRCPHCAAIEPSDFTLGINHGYWEHTSDPAIPACTRRKKDSPCARTE
ncbi:hypothetical protein ONR57_22985 [Hoyosella sp. YIM 151337]|uniref:hypothetical protein n=1 Tax=Hoyosella sp. YIM 151337 TaxID=2992742 RepID=UPI002235A72D|nr:hypothetical protein [Hoyosella sp. YIM 151337]MCW4356176.1 hypothetical protein [Hoyosella sp. YIM 151337]